MNQNKGIKAKEMAENMIGFEPLRFSRSSTPISLKNIDSEQLTNGTFLTLCRVLMINIHSVIATEVTDEDFYQAKMNGCDTIHHTIL
jgi:hypothetical protein